MPTPFAGEGSILDLEGFRANLLRWMRHPLAGVLVLGSNGEAPLLSDAECDAVIGMAREAVPPDRCLLVGTGRASTRATVESTRRAFAAGADAVLVVTPSYYRGRMDAVALAAHYEKVADDGGGPVLLYHVPAFTGIDLPVEVVLELAQHPRIVGIKDSSGETGRIEALAGGAPAGFAVLTGSAPILHPALAAGAVGAVVAVACVAPDICCDLMEAVRHGQPAEAAALQARLTPLALAVTRGHGIPGLKALLDNLGWHGGPVRRPLRDLEPVEREDLLTTWQHFEATKGVLA